MGDDVASFVSMFDCVCLTARVAFAMHAVSGNVTSFVAQRFFTIAEIASAADGSPTHAPPACNRGHAMRHNWRRRVGQTEATLPAASQPAPTIWRGLCASHRLRLPAAPLLTRRRRSRVRTRAGGRSGCAPMNIRGLCSMERACLAAYRDQKALLPRFLRRVFLPVS